MSDTCKWTPWNEDIYGTGTHDTECGEAHSFIEGDILDNKYQYCPYCGKPIELVEVVR